MLTQTNHNLQGTSPEEQGIASSAILDFVDALERQVHEVHSFMLLRHGAIVAEGWWSPYERRYPHMLFSLSKSFTSTAVGLAMEEGFFSIDDAVLSFFPDEAPTEQSEFLQAMRVRHLLSMSTGHAEDTMPHMFDREDLNWIKGFLSVPVIHTPGTHFLYNTGATYMLSAIVQKTTGKKLTEFLKPRLFEPLGIENATWEESPQGIETGGFGLNLKTEDIAHFGQLYLQKGIWQGKRILSEAWIAEASAFQVSNGDSPDSDWTQGYGYQFWRCRHHAYRGDGAFGQYCIIMPEQDAVLALTGGLSDMQIPMNIIWEILLPAMESKPLPENSASWDALMAKLSSLALPFVAGQASSPIAAQVSGKTYHADENEMHLESIKLNFSGSACVVTLKTAASEQIIGCGYGNWQQSETTLFNLPWENDAKPFVASGAWVSENHFSMRIQLYKTPFFYSVDFHFDGDDLRIETRVNVSFEPATTQVITAHAV